jgi:hypothetical protein
VLIYNRLRFALIETTITKAADSMEDVPLTGQPFGHLAQAGKRVTALAPIS